MILKCPKCNCFCAGKINQLVNVGVNGIDKISSGFNNIKEQLSLSSSKIQGMGKGILKTTSSLLDWEDYYVYECNSCGEKGTIKKSLSEDFTDEFYRYKETQFVQKTGERFLIIDPNADCYYDSDDNLFLLRAIPQGIILPDNKYKKDTIYISHPANLSVFYPSTSYRYDVMKDELNDIIKFLQKLGAKLIRISGEENREEKTGIHSFLKTSVGVNTVETDYSASYSSSTSDDNFNRQNKRYLKEIKSELLHMPIVDDVLLAKWAPIRKEWDDILDMREHGILEFDFTLSVDNITSHIHSNIETIEAEYKQMCATASAAVNRKIIKSLRENSHIGFNIHVEFYGASDYNKFKPNAKDNIQSAIKRLLKL